MPRTGERVFQRIGPRSACSCASAWAGDITMHGFRSSFSTWCAEATRFEPEVREAALAHGIRDKTMAAYQRGTLLQKRAKLMQSWSDFCASPPRAKNAATVVALHG